MPLAISKGIVVKPIRALLYGPEGIGKTRFAAAWPKPLFIDIEEGSNQISVERTPRPTSWAMLVGMVDELMVDPMGYKTLVFDTADWADKLATSQVCATASKGSISDFAWGQGWVALAEEWKRFLDKLALFQERTHMNILFLAHAKVQRLTLPDATGSFDRYELKMEHQKSAAPLKEWVDLMIFANYKTYIVTTKDDKQKGQGGQERVMFTEHHACWDAKNRFRLPYELPFNLENPQDPNSRHFGWEAIKHLFAPAPAPAPAPQPATPPAAPAANPPVKVDDDAELLCLPQDVQGLLKLHKVTGIELRNAIKRAYPVGTPFNVIPPTFWAKLVSSWDTLMTRVTDYRNQIQGA